VGQDSIDAEDRVNKFISVLLNHVSLLSSTEIILNDFLVNCFKLIAISIASLPFAP